MADEQEERKRVGVAREYRDGRISVYWAPEFCIHTARCINAQPQVFDPMRRPWVVLDDAGADAIAQAVRCLPDRGAHLLAQRRWARRSRAGTAQRGAMAERVAALPARPCPGRRRARKCGAEATRVALCRCGGSENKPYCDGTHRAIGFQA